MSDSFRNVSVHSSCDPSLNDADEVFYERDVHAYVVDAWVYIFYFDVYYGAEHSSFRDSFLLYYVSLAPALVHEKRALDLDMLSLMV